MNRVSQQYFSILAVLSSLTTSLVLAQSGSFAQITPDQSLGSNPSVLTPNVEIKGQPALQIEGGVSRGTALFHSFSQFNIGEAQRVYFANPIGIQNIFTRITGNEISHIFGTLGVSGGADLFLLNPNGIVFGPNARLDLAGSLLATTRDRILFSDGSEFSATHPNTPPLLTLNLTPGVQLGNSRPEAIILNQGRLETGRDLTLDAGTLTVQGTLQPGRNLTLNAVNDLQLQGATLSLASQPGQFGNITIRSPANTLIDHSTLTTTSSATNQLNGGNIFVSAANLTLRDTQITSSTQGSGKGGNLHFETPNGITNLSKSRLSAATFGAGQGGSIVFNAQQLNIQEATSMRSSTYGTGQGGNVEMMSPESISISRAIIAVDTRGPGVAGDLRVQTPTLSFDAARFTTTVGVLDPGQAPSLTGKGGAIDVRADTINLGGKFVDFPSPDQLSGIFAGTFSPIPAGNIHIQPWPGHPSVTLNGVDQYAHISAEGGGGNITFSAPDSVILRGPSIITVSTRFPAPAGQLRVQTGTLNIEGTKLYGSTFGAGTGGTILIEGNALSLTQEGQIRTSTLGAGTAGNIELKLRDRLTLSGPETGLFSNSGPNSTGKGGSISIDPETVRLENGATLSVDSEGQGEGGSITLKAGNLQLDGNALITAQTQNSDGGNVNLQVDHVLLLRHDSAISASAGGVGNGGNIQIKAGFLVAPTIENSDITANAFRGNGGNLQITSQSIFGLKFRSNLTPLSDITASSTFGADGQVTLNTPNLDPQNGLVSLPSNLVDASQQIVQGCVAGRSLSKGRFTLSGRGGLPPSPDVPLVGTTLWQDVDPDPAQNPHSSLLSQAQTLNQQGIQQFEQGKAETAIASWQQAVKHYTQAGSETGRLGSLMNLVQAQQSLGFYRQAQTNLLEAFPTLQQQPDSRLKALAFLQLGNTLRLTGALNSPLDRSTNSSDSSDSSPVTASQILETALAIAQRIHATDLEASIDISLGNVAWGEKQWDNAIAHYQRAQTVSQHLAPNSLLPLQAALNKLSLLIAQQKQKPQPQQLATIQALIPALQAKIIHLPINHEILDARLHFAYSLIQLGHPNVMENTVRSLLQSTLTAAKNLQDPRAQSYALGYLGLTYEKNHQWKDAQTLTEQALWIAQSIQASDIAYQWEWQLGRILRQQNQIQPAKLAFSNAYHTLNDLRQDLIAVNPDIQFNFREQVEPVYRSYIDLLLPPGEFVSDSSTSQTNLKQVRTVLESLRWAELTNFFRETCLQQTSLDQIAQSSTAAVIYPILLPDRLAVIVSFPDQMQAYAINLPQSSVESTIKNLRQELEKPYTSPKGKQLSQQLYAWLIQPIKKQLNQTNIKTLVFVLDGKLRNVPMAALYDGHQYLIEQYAVALAPGLSLLSPTPLKQQSMHTLLVGLTQARQGFAELSNVGSEIKTVQSLVPSKVLLDETFTKQNFKTLVGTSPFSIVHLATHGQFGSTFDKTFVLTWDDRLNINELRSLLQTKAQTRSEALDLLVLSACETATGDDHAALGLAGVSVQSGARSTLASLWSMDDKSGAFFIRRFYEALVDQKLGRAEALRQAQRALLQDPSYRHPRYWAPYILIGNWL